MAYGPVELLAVRFPGNQFKGEIAPALEDLVRSGTVRIIDLLFAIKDADGTVTVMEVDGFGDTAITMLAPLATPEHELLSESDARHFGELLEPNSSVALLLFENTWAANFAQALRNANAELLVNERIPRAVIEEVVAWAEANP